MASLVVSHSSSEFGVETLLFMGQLSPVGMTIVGVSRSPERVSGTEESWVQMSDVARSVVSGSEKQQQVLRLAARQPRHLRTVLLEVVQPSRHPPLGKRRSQVCDRIAEVVMPSNDFMRRTTYPDVFIPGGGGAALVFMPVQVIVRGEEFEVQGLGVDISLVDPERVATHRSRPMTELDLIELHAFFRAAALDAAPEVSAPTFQSVGLGLLLSVPLSEEARVDVSAVVSITNEGQVVDTDDFRFTTTRTALLQAADRVRLIGEHFGYAIDQADDLEPDAFVDGNDQKGSE